MTTQIAKMKQSQIFFHRASSNLTPYLFYQNTLKYFNEVQNRIFSAL